MRYRFKKRWNKVEFFNRRRLVKKDVKKNVFLFLKNNFFLSKNKIFLIVFNFRKWLKLSWSFSKYRNRCWSSGRARGINRLTRVSRITVKEMCYNGLMLGMKKKIW